MKPLTIEEIEEARKRTGDTATSLIDAAETMLEAGHWPLALFLAHTAVEEIAKIPMLVGVAHDIIVGRTIDWKEVGKRQIQQTWIGLHINANEKISNPELLVKAREWFSPDGDAMLLREHALYAGVVNRSGEPWPTRARTK